VVAGGDKRTRLVQAADDLVYRNGYASATLADIAGAAGVPVGNVYYYFRTKESLASAVIATRGRVYAARRDDWDRTLQPRDRVLGFIAMSVDARRDLALSGCPIGSLCSELQKPGSPLGAEAGQLFCEWLDWLGAQFEALGHSRRDAGAQSLHLLSRLQGATLLARALRSVDVLVDEAARASAWIESL